MSLSGPRRAGIDAVAMFIYTSIVYVWALPVHPLGRDYAFLAVPGRTMPFLAHGLFRWETATFGGWTWGYHLVNLALLYGCMLCLYRLVKWVVRGPFWMGTLAAALFMANPVHTEAVVNLGGVADLMPCLAALLATMLYVENASAPRCWKAVLALASLAWALLAYPENAGILFVIVLFEWLIAGNTEGRLRRIAPVAIIGFGMVLFAFFTTSFRPAPMFAPLYFVFYPLGFLPENARTFCAHPGLGWLAAGVVACIAWLIHRKARHPAIPFGLAAMICSRLFLREPFVDPVHLIGGGQLLLATAWFNVALVAVFARMMEHRKWQRPVVVFTTLLCAAFFGMQIHANLKWRETGRMVRQFQTDAQAVPPPVTVLPDYQYYDGAPMQLSWSIAWDTPFSKRVPALSTLPLHYDPSLKTEVSVQDGSATVVVKGKNPSNAVCHPYSLAREGANQETEDCSIETTRLEHDTISFRVTPKAGPWPAIIPFVPYVP